MKNNILGHITFHLKYFLTYRRLNLIFGFFFQQTVSLAIERCKKKLVVEIFMQIFFLIFVEIYVVVLDKIKHKTPLVIKKWVKRLKNGFLETYMLKASKRCVTWKRQFPEPFPLRLGGKISNLLVAK